MQQQYKTEQLITRTNYRKHKQKLQQIKNNVHNTSLQFYSSGKNKPLDRKKLLMLKMKREEIQHQNQYLRNKINKINQSVGASGSGVLKEVDGKKTGNRDNRRGSLSMASYGGGQNIAKNQRYAEHDNQKMQVISDCGDGDNVRCFVPSGKKVKYASMSQSKAADYNAIIFNLRQKHKKLQNQNKNQQLISSSNPNDNPQFPPPSFNQSLTNIITPKLNNLIRQSTNITRDQLLYNQPQKQAYRLVLYKKTKIIMPMISFLIQISIIDKQLLIVAYGMGVVTQDYKLLIDRKKSRYILQQIQGDYQKLWQKIYVNQNGIKILDFNNLNNNNTYQQQQQKQSINKPQQQIIPISSSQRQRIRQQKKYEITQDFLQRNYYTLIKQQGMDKYRLLEEDNKNKQQRNKNKIEYQAALKVNMVNNGISNGNGNGNKPRSIFRKKIDYNNIVKNNNNNNDDKQKHHIVGINKKSDNKQNNTNKSKPIQKQTKKQHIKTNKSDKNQDEQNNNNNNNNNEDGNEQYEFQQQYEMQQNQQKQKQKNNKDKDKDEDEIYNDEYQQIQQQSVKNQSKITNNNKSNISNNNNNNNKNMDKNGKNKNKNKNLQKSAQLIQDYQLSYQNLIDNESMQINNNNNSNTNNNNKNNNNNSNNNNKNNSKNNSKNNNKHAQQQQPQQQYQYSMQYDSNPSKVLNNKSSINAVKKKTINNNSKISDQIQYQNYDDNQFDNNDSNTYNNNNNNKNNNNSINNNSVNMNKSKNINKSNSKQIEQQYIQQFDN